jgi:hypothetical protein
MRQKTLNIWGIRKWTTYSEAHSYVFAKFYTHTEYVADHKLYNSYLGTDHLICIAKVVAILVFRILYYVINLNIKTNLNYNIMHF